ncbi:MAG: DUF2752 domain-containing protein [Bacteroidales bacterium]
MIKHSELVFWIAGLLTLAISDPCHTHYTLCLFKLMGLNFCPGCGLGHSIGFLFRGEILSSLQAHPLGIPALFFILLRIYRLLSNKPIVTFKQLFYGRNVHVATKS